MTALPTGTVTFLFTDIEGSTERWEHHRAAMTTALARHDALLRSAIESHAGHVFKTIGDAFQAAFASPVAALQAAAAAQRALAAEDWSACGPGFPGLRVRMALHVGPAAADAAGDYRLPLLNRTARLMSAGHGGQVLLSLATQQLVRDDLPPGCTLRDLGLHRLKDLRHSEHIYQLVGPGFPDVRTPPDTAEKLPDRGERAADIDLPPAACPYRGLAAFREADARFFFGREAFTDLLVESVEAAPMVGVIGPSGSGKSSVVFAGLAPRLKAAAGGGTWTVVELRPGSRPYHALAGAMLPLYEGADLTETERLAEVNRLADYLRAGTISPRDVLGRAGERHPDLGRLLLVADQFEELYTLCPEESEHRGFQDLLFAAAFEGNGGRGGGGPPLTLVLTLRADFMGHALAYRPFADAIQKHDVKLGPMTREELARAIRLPAEAQGRAFESGLVERIIEDVGEKAGTLPLLEFALTKLWDEQEGGWLTHAAYEAIGRVEGAVARHADGVYGRLREAEREGARQVFVQLVQPGEGTEDTRRLAVREELGKDWGLVRRLADARLVTTGRDEAGHETAEVVHEALIRSWERLREWINADRRFRTWQERLRFALRQWEASGRDEGALLRGAPLAEAEGWLKERGEALGEGERAYVAAGLELRDRRAREREAQLEREAASARKLRRQRVFLSITLAAAIVLAGVAAILGHRSRQTTARAEAASANAFARELAGASMANRERDPELSVLLALKAISVSQTAGGAPVPEPEQALHLALQYTRRKQTLATHELGIYDLAVSPDGRHLATCGLDGIKRYGIKLIDLVTGDTEITMSQPITWVWTVAFSPDGTLLASGGEDGVVSIWNTKTGENSLRLTGHTKAVTQVSFSPDGTSLASASKDTTAVVWDIPTSRAVLTLTGHTKAVKSVAWSPDGTRLATAGEDGLVNLWDSSTGISLLSILNRMGNVTSPLYSVAFSSDAARLATGGVNARIWDAANGNLMQEFQGHGDSVAEVAFNADGKKLLTASSDKTAGIWDVAGVGGGYGAMFRLAGHTGPIRGVAFTPDGLSAVTASGDGTLGVWDITDGRAWRTLHVPGTRPRSIAFSPDGRSVAVASRDDVARVWDLDRVSTSATITLTGHISEVWTVAFSPDGRTVATSGNDRTVKLWEAESGRLIRTLIGHSNAVWGVAFSPDGSQVATGSDDDTARLWDTHSGRSLLTMKGHIHDVNAVAFSPDGSRLVTASNDRTAKVWDVTTGEELLNLIGHSGSLVSVSYAPDGSRIATTSDLDRSARVWDATSGHELFSISSHLGPVQGVDFSPDGTRLVTSSWDGTVTVWDAVSGEDVLTVAENSGALVDANYSPDGAYLAVGSQVGNVYIYTLRLDELIALAHERVKRPLTDEECRVYLHVEACPADAAGTVQQAP